MFFIGICFTGCCHGMAAAQSGASTSSLDSTVDTEDKYSAIYFDLVYSRILDLIGPPIVRVAVGTVPSQYRCFFGAGNGMALSIDKYLCRFKKWLRCSPECFVLALIYVCKIIKIENRLVNSYSIFRIFLAAIVAAAKFNDDKLCSERYYAEVGGISVAELNKLEIEILFLLKFDLYVSNAYFQGFIAVLKIGSLKNLSTSAVIKFDSKEYAQDSEEYKQYVNGASDALFVWDVEKRVPHKYPYVELIKVADDEWNIIIQPLKK